MCAVCVRKGVSEILLRCLKVIFEHNEFADQVSAIQGIYYLFLFFMSPNILADVIL